MQLSVRICRGPKRVPGRFEVPISMGMPTKQASSPSVVDCVGRRIIVAGPPKRGISLPPSGWLKVLVVIASLRRDGPRPGYELCRPGESAGPRPECGTNAPAFVARNERKRPSRTDARKGLSGKRDRLRLAGLDGARQLAPFAIPRVEQLELSLD